MCLLYEGFLFFTLGIPPLWYFLVRYYKKSEFNPKEPSSGSSRVLRGGSGNKYEVSCGVSSRGKGIPSYRGGQSGFRVVTQN